MKRQGLIFLSCLIFGCSSRDQSVELPLFEDLSAIMTKVDFRNDIPESATMNSFVYEYYYNGGGVAIGDLNGDGLSDIFFTANLDKNALYLNTGDFQFINVTEKSGVAGKEGWSTGVSLVDINADEKLDIHVCYSGPFQDERLRANELFINQGNNSSGYPSFKESAKEYGLADTSFSTQAAYLDYDQDGDLDMFLLNHNPSRVPEDELTTGRESFTAIGDKFYENVQGKFIDKTREVGIYSNSISYGLGVGVGDVNHDGWPDIYVSNDYEEMDYLYLNQQNKTFKESIQAATRHIPNFSMGNDIADYDNDGLLDFVVLDMVSEDNYGIKTSMPSMNPQLFNKRVSQGFHHQYMYNALQRNTSYMDENQIPHFTDAGRIAGITNTGWSWAPLLVDLDNDGWKDIFISNGIKRDFRNNDFNIYLKNLLNSDPSYLNRPNQMQEVLSKIPQKPLKNYLYKNNGDLTYEKVTDTWWPDNKPTFSNGAAYGDLDNDGDLDLVINNIDSKASILRNHSNKNYLNVKFKGSKNNPEGIGAKLYVWVAGRSQYFEHYRVRGFQSSVSSGLIVGLGSHVMIDSIKAEWPGGKVQLIKNVKANQTLTIDQSEAGPMILLNPYSEKLFSKTHVQEELMHSENDFDDYQKQILLPHKLSQFGPALAVADVNADGLEDIYLGQSAGTASGIWIQQEGGRFNISQSFDAHKASEDVDALFFDYDKDGDQDLYVVTGGNEYLKSDPNYADHFYLNEEGVFMDASHLLPALFESGSIVRASDFNSDGRVDLFVGTRHVPGAYPSPASSYLLLNTATGFEDISTEIAPELEKLGLVTDMAWSDYDSDGDTDLLIVGEWMKPTILSNSEGHFKIEPLDELDSLVGWYNAIQAVDIDNDGDQDYLLGNLGNNYKYKATANEPFEVYYADFDGNGIEDIVLGYYNFGELFPVRGRQCSSQQVPDLKSQFTNYHSFGSSSLPDIYKIDGRSDLLEYKSRNFSSGVLLNTASGFDFKPFPNLAQLSSINDFLVDDFNEDGHEDLLIGGNLYQSEIETPRNDAGYGLLLLGDGLGNFKPVDATISGFYLAGESRKLDELSIEGKRHVLAGINSSRIQLRRVNQQ
ncbi:MAG: VCBS repeat-containing protein [Reichenbachiella sp.]|uniref:VCBS repeat-containing protein n=3 Tax=Reichenbachiella sp. TaxID=2184521 RepID=UPI003267BD9B